MRDERTLPNAGGLPNLPEKSMRTLARIVGHMATGGSVEIRIRLHQGGVRAYNETTSPLEPEASSLPSEEDP